MSESEIKDAILEFCLKDGTDDNFIIITEIIDDLFPKMSHEEMMYYIFEIEKHPEFVIDRFEFNDTYTIKVNIATKKFMEKGGFSKIEENRIKKESFEFELAESNLAANKLNKKIAKQNLRNEKKNRITTWINIVIGIINIALLVWQIVKD